MAEMLLATGIDKRSPLKLGDIASVSSTRDVMAGNADRLCTESATVTSDGLRPADSLQDDWCRLTRRHCFRRVSRTEIEVIDLSTDQKVGTVNGTQPGPWGQMDVDAYVRRRLKHKRHAIFGTPNREYWYSTKLQEITWKMLMRIWDAIEDRIGESRKKHRKRKLAPVEHRQFLPVGIVDLKQADVGLLQCPVAEIRQFEKDGGWEMQLKAILKRLFFMPIDLLLEETSLTPGQLVSPKKWVDLRDDNAFVTPDVVEIK